MRAIQVVIILEEKEDVQLSAMATWMLDPLFLNSMASVGLLIPETKIIMTLKRQDSTFGQIVRTVSDGRLLTKNNYGHSTLTVNNALHVNNGFASIADYKGGEKPEVTIDMSKIFGGLLNSASRRFVKEDNRSILIEDKFQLSDSTENITWQLITTADVQIINGGAILKQGGKQLKLENLSHPQLDVSIISLDPPPLALDKTIEGLKRIEIRMPAYLFNQKEGRLPKAGKLTVRLSGVE